jgi:hypothetical protein
MTEAPVLAATDLGEVVGLTAVEVRAVDAVDRTRVVEERSRVGVGRRERELVGDLRAPVVVVVDVDRVGDVVAELEEVRAAGGILERDVVGDDRDGVRPVGLTKA